MNGKRSRLHGERAIFQFIETLGDPKSTPQAERAAKLRFQCEDISELIADWRSALQAVATWRKKESEHAVAIQILVQIPHEAAWSAANYFVSRLLVSPSDRPREIQDLSIDLAFVDADENRHFDLVIYPSSTAFTVGFNPISATQADESKK